MANELNASETFLYGLLHGDAQLLTAAPGDVHRDVAPEGETRIVVVFQYQGGSDARAMGRPLARIWTEVVYLVKAIAREGQHQTLQAAADRIDAVLDGARGTAGTARIYSCVRDAPFSVPVTEKGITYRQVGGTYRLQVQEPAAV